MTQHNAITLRHAGNCRAIHRDSAATVSNHIKRLRHTVTVKPQPMTPIGRRCVGGSRNADGISAGGGRLDGVDVRATIAPTKLSAMSTCAETRNVNSSSAAVHQHQRAIGLKTGCCRRSTLPFHDDAAAATANGIGVANEYATVSARCSG